MSKGSVIDHALLSFLDENVLWCDEKVWDESPRPTRERNDKLVSVLFVHGFVDLLHVCSDRGIVPLSPVL